MSRTDPQAMERVRQQSQTTHPSHPRPTPPMLAQGIEHYEAGRMGEAEQLCLQILAADARHADALYLLGMVGYRTGRFETAVRMIRRAIAVNDRQPFYHSNLGNALQAQDKLDEAVTCFEQALVLNPQFAEACYNLGNARKAQGKLEEAVTCYRQALTLNPNYVEVYTNLGAVLQVQNKLEEAQACLERVVAHSPQDASAHYNLGMALYAQKKMVEAETCFEHSLTLNPQAPEPHYNLGNLLQAQGRLDEALVQYDLALAPRPSYAEAYYKKGLTLSHQGKLEEAILCFDQALAYRKDYAEAYNNKGMPLYQQGKLEEAVYCLEQALIYRKDYAEAHNNLGLIRNYQGRHKEAITCFESALAIRQDYADARFNLSLLELLMGDFGSGWDNYEFRRSQKNVIQRIFTQPQWRGEALQGARILLYAEQGLGDSLQFLRYLPMVQAAGGIVVLEIQKRLRRIASLLPGVAALVDAGDPLPPFDWQCSLMSLPLAFDTNLETIPAQVPYLSIPEAAQQTADALGWPEEGLRIGLVWAGNIDHRDDRHRSLSLEVLEPILGVKGVHFFSLQMGPAEAQLAFTQAKITNLSPVTGDMADTAAQMAHLDLVITIDTSVAHLAGALAKPVWLLLSAASDWRWLRDREDSPWYPTMRLFRQPKLGDWPSVVEAVRVALLEESRSLLERRESR